MSITMQLILWLWPVWTLGILLLGPIFLIWVHREYKSGRWASREGDWDEIKGYIPGIFALIVAFVHWILCDFVTAFCVFILLLLVNFVLIALTPFTKVGILVAFVCSIAIGYWDIVYYAWPHCNIP